MESNYFLLPPRSQQSCIGYLEFDQYSPINEIHSIQYLSKLYLLLIPDYGLSHGTISEFGILCWITLYNGSSRATCIEDHLDHETTLGCPHRLRLHY
jgi:hypothetical protein